MPLLDLCVVGQGHIGLPTAVAFASADLDVLGVDIEPELVEDLNNGVTRITEPGLQDSLRNVLKSGQYRAALKPEPAHAFIVSVPTPIDENDQPVLDFALAAARSLAPHIQPGSLVILESTVPPGTTSGAFATAIDAESKLAASEYLVAHCPERVLPGQIMHELIHNDRVVGGTTEEASQAAVNLYRSFVLGEIEDANVVEGGHGGWPFAGRRWGESTPIGRRFGAWRDSGGGGAVLACRFIGRGLA